MPKVRGTLRKRLEKRMQKIKRKRAQKLKQKKKKQKRKITVAEAHAIARDAYIYGFPLVDSYRIQYAYFVDPNNPEYKGAWNQVHSMARVFTPEDKAVQTPNSDTPYSMLGMNLRAEPIVLTVPVVERGRYFSVQLIDAYTFNFAYIGSRATGNDGGSFLIAGPRWKGTKPDGVKTVIRSETEIVLAAYRTQLFNADDIENVKKIQAGYKAQTLSQFLGKPSPAAAPEINFIKPLTPDEERTSPEFFNILNFVLQFCPTVPSEKKLMTRFAKLNIGANRTFDVRKLTPELLQAVKDGVADAWQSLSELKKKVDSGQLSSGEVFGTRQFLKNNYLYRMGAAVFGIFGNSREEAMYPIYFVDQEGQKLDGSRKYSLRFPPGQLPPVNAFWSLTMYEMPASLLVANPLNRYLINSPMLPNLKRDTDDGLTLLIQHDSPGSDNESNWLPAPAGPFAMFLRLYWPKPEAFTGAWKQPPLTHTS